MSSQQNQHQRHQQLNAEHFRTGRDGISVATFSLLLLFGSMLTITTLPTSVVGFSTISRPGMLALTYRHVSSPPAFFSLEAETDHQAEHSASMSGVSNGNDNDGDELSEERKASLFQFLLRDLQVEGTPLLGCDARDTHTFFAAAFTTMAELSLENNTTKACLILEDIPMDTLRQFVDEFGAVKSETRLMEELPELKRFNVSLVGRGLLGPAMILETSTRTTQEEKQYVDKIKVETSQDDVNRWTAGQKTFVSRMIEGGGGSGVSIPSHHTQQQQDHPVSVAYRFAGSTDVCDILAGFWYNICELQTTNVDDIGCVMFCYPTLPSSSGAKDKKKAGERYAAVAEVINRVLSLYSKDISSESNDGDETKNEEDNERFKVVHVNPLYERETIHPQSQHQQEDDGHLPPASWLRSMIEAVGDENVDLAESLSDQQLSIQNYQRRSPLPGVLIERSSLLDSNVPPGDLITQIFVDGVPHMVSGCSTNSKNLKALIDIGEDTLEESLKKEIDIVS